MNFRVTYVDETRPETHFVRDIEAEGPCIAIQLVMELALGAFPKIPWRFQTCDYIQRQIFKGPPADDDVEGIAF